MSRTWSHAPYYVKAWRARNTRDSEIFHSLGCERSQPRRWSFYRDQPDRECNIEDYNPRLRHEYGRKYDSGHCVWELKWPYPFTNNVGYSGVRQARRDEYNGKQRASARSVGRDAVKEYNGSGNCEPDYMDGRTRHSVMWDME